MKKIFVIAGLILATLYSCSTTSGISKISEDNLPKEEGIYQIDIANNKYQLITREISKLYSHTGRPWGDGKEFFYIDNSSANKVFNNESASFLVINAGSIKVIKENIRIYKMSLNSDHDREVPIISRSLPFSMMGNINYIKNSRIKISMKKAGTNAYLITPKERLENGHYCLADKCHDLDTYLKYYLPKMKLGIYAFDIKNRER